METTYNLTVLLWVIIGTVTGTCVRTLYPYLLKLISGAEEFDAKYLKTAALSAVVTVLGGGVSLPAYAPDTPWYMAFLLSLSAAISLQTLFRQTESAQEDRKGSDFRVVDKGQALKIGGIKLSKDELKNLVDKYL